MIVSVRFCLLFARWHPQKVDVMLVEESEEPAVSIDVASRQVEDDMMEIS
jgi:hypothetical protein